LRQAELRAELFLRKPFGLAGRSNPIRRQSNGEFIGVDEVVIAGFYLLDGLAGELELDEALIFIQRHEHVRGHTVIDQIRMSIGGRLAYFTSSRVGFVEVTARYDAVRQLAPWTA
jgi:hypothetical protein